MECTVNRKVNRGKSFIIKSMNISRLSFPSQNHIHLKSIFRACDVLIKFTTSNMKSCLFKMYHIIKTMKFKIS